MRVFGDLYSELARHVFDDSVNATLNHKRWTNLGYHKVYYDADYPFQRKSGTFATVSGTRLYTPEPNAIKILNIRIPSENAYLTKIGVERLDRSRPEYVTDTNTQTPFAWYNEDWVGASTQPTVAAAIYVSSTATEVNLTVTVEGIVSGEMDRETGSLNGVTPNFTTTKTFTEITSISKGAISVGVITAKQTNASGATLSTVGPLQYTRRYIRIGLEGVPGSALTCYYRFTPWLPEMVNDSDVPNVPDQDIPLIVDAAMLIAAENHGDPAVLASREGRYREKLAKLRSRLGEDKDTIHQWGHKGGRIGYEIIAGDYSSFLRHMYWG